MWPEKDIEYVKLKDDECGRHFGLFVNNSLVSVISFFAKNDIVQFRKFATLQELQGKGYGSVLLNFVLKEVEKQGAKSLWCNARVNKIDFYKKFGLEKTGTTAIKDEMEYAIMNRTF